MNATESLNKENQKIIHYLNVLKEDFESSDIAGESESFEDDDIIDLMQRAYFNRFKAMAAEWLESTIEEYEVCLLEDQMFSEKGGE